METRPVIVDRNGQTRLTLNCHGNKVDWEIPRAALVYPEGPSGHEYVNSSISLESHLTEVIHTKVMRSPSAWNPKSTACLKGSHTSLSFPLNYVSQVYLDPLSWSLCLSHSLLFCSLIPLRENFIPKAIVLPFGSLRVSSSWILERGTLFCFVLDLLCIVYLCSSLSARVSLSSLFGCSLSVVIDGLALLRDCSPWTWLMIWFPHGFPHMASAEITQAEKCFSHQLIPRAADQSINQTLWSEWSELDRQLAWQRQWHGL